MTDTEIILKEIRSLNNKMALLVSEKQKPFWCTASQIMTSTIWDDKRKLERARNSESLVTRKEGRTILYDFNSIPQNFLK